MKLQCITLSGLNENTAPLTLIRLPKRGIELAIQVNKDPNPIFSASGDKWLQWLKWVRKQTFYTDPMRFALHITEDWVVDFCKGNISTEFFNIFRWETHDRRRFITRVQLNFQVGRDCPFDPEELIRTMKLPPFNFVRFILPWNEANAGVLQKVHEAGIKFDCLFDNSSGKEGEAYPYRAPIFDGNCPEFMYKGGFSPYFGVGQGYSGKFSPENMLGELYKIAEVVPEDAPVWINAGELITGDDDVDLVTADRFFKLMDIMKYEGFGL